MAHSHRSGIRKVAYEIGHEAKRQLRGFGREAKWQLGGFKGEASRQLGGFGREFAKQLFGAAGHRRRGT
jgi:hypothetical protein